MSPETKSFTAGAIVLWTVAALAAISMVRGNPTAINAVIGAGVGAMPWTAVAWVMARQDQRWRR
jgi:hypothetical protein